MNNDHFEPFCEAWNAACSMTGNRKEASPIGLDVAFEGLKEFEFSQVTQALSDHLKTSEFQPTVAGITALIQGTPDEQAQAAWLKVNQAIRRVGTGPSLIFDDPKIHIVVTEMGGLQRFGSAKESDWGFIEREFCKRYLAIKGRRPHPPRLGGWHTDGSQKMIGDPEKCRQVASTGNANNQLISDAGDVATQLVSQHLG